MPAPNQPFHMMNAFPRGSALSFLDADGDEEHPGKLDWEKKRQEVFNSMSSHMKATWARPPPGSSLNSYDDAKAYPETVSNIGEAANEEDKRNTEIALSNFALVLIEPHEIDWVQLGVAPNRRTRFTRLASEGNGDEWEEQIQVP